MRRAWVLSVLVVAGCGGVDLPAPSDSAAFVDHVAEVVPGLLDEFDVPGASVALIEDGMVLWSSGFGVADVDSGDPMLADTVFRVASISKPVAAWAILRLADVGTIDLDAPVNSYLSRWRLPGSEFDVDGVTARRLLSHTAGTSVSYLNFFYEPNPLPSLEELLAGAGSDEGPVVVVAEPGTQYRYSGGGFAILELLVEEVTGGPFAEWTRREVLHPLGMHDSTFERPPALTPLAAGHDQAGQPIPPYQYSGTAGAGLFSTAPDLGRFVAAAMFGPNDEPPGRDVLMLGTIEQMLTPVIDTPEVGTAQGLGYFLDNRSAVLVAGHSGRDFGWSAKVLFIPATQRGIVILTNSENGEDLHIELGCQWAAWASDQAIDDACP